jgi:hypothetical protein
VIALGVDPGLDGAAVLTDGAAVIGWWTWHHLAAGKRKAERWTMAGHPELPESEWPVCGSLHDVAEEITEQVLAPPPYRVDVVAVEGLYQAGHSVITLAESAGELVGPLRCLAPIVRPRASTWRPVILGSRRWTSAEAEGAAVDQCRLRLDWHPPTAHAAEAACIALWALAACKEAP